LARRLSRQRPSFPGVSQDGQAIRIKSSNGLLHDHSLEAEFMKGGYHFVWQYVFSFGSNSLVENDNNKIPFGLQILEFLQKFLFGHIGLFRFQGSRLHDGEGIPMPKIDYEIGLGLLRERPGLFGIAEVPY
jgi:hypothetical protein